MALRGDTRPLYLQAAAAIRNLIAEEGLTTGARLPTEHALGASLGISRSTVREALRALEREGMVASRQGAGTFLVEQTRGLRSSLATLRSTTALIRDAGFEPGSRLVAITVDRPDSAVAEALAVPIDASVVLLDRVRTADGQPLCFVHDVFPGDQELVDAYRAEAPDSLLDFLGRHQGAEVMLSYCEIRAAGALGNVARAFDVEEGTAVLQLDQHHVTREGTPVLLSRSYWRTQDFAFHLVRRMAAA